jgi:hypothetical protein
MSMQPQATELQAYHMLLYRGPVHPEFFNITVRRETSHADFEFEAWAFRGGHVLRFEHATTTLCEVVTSDAAALPERGLVTNMPCSGERDYEEVFGERITFVTSIQTESLSEHLFLGTHREMLEHGQDPACLMTNWTDAGSHPSLSLIEFQRYNDQVHVQSYHLRGDSLTVLRTQSILQAGVEAKDDQED